MLFYWLIQALTAIEALLKPSQDLLNLLSSDFFPKVATSFTCKALTPYAGILSCIFDTLPDVLSKPDP